MHFANGREVVAIAKKLNIAPQYIEKWDDGIDNGFAYLIHRTPKAKNDYQYSPHEVIANFSYIDWLGEYEARKQEKGKSIPCNGVQREHNKKLNNGLPILHKVPPKRDYGRYFCIMAEKGGTSHGGLTEKLSPFFHAKKQEVNAYGR